MNCTRIDTSLNRQRSPSSADRLQALFRFVQTVAVSDLEVVSGVRVQKKRAYGRRARNKGGQGSERDLSKGDALDAAASTGPRGTVEKSRCSSKKFSAANSSRRCTYGSCRKYASYGDPGRRVLLFCGRHKKAGNIDLKNRLCMFPEGCTARATYGTFLPRAADRAAGLELGTSLPGLTGEGVGMDSTAGKGPDSDASGGCRAQAASPEGLPVDRARNLTSANYLGFTGDDGERKVGTGDGARCDSRDTNERQGRRGVRGRGRAPAIDVAFCAAHHRPCDVQLYRRSLPPSLYYWLRAGGFCALPLIEISIFLHALGLLLIYYFQILRSGEVHQAADVRQYKGRQSQTMRAAPPGCLLGRQKPAMHRRA